MAPVVALCDGGMECLDCRESAAEKGPGGADVLHADGGAHVFACEIGIEDFGDFVPGTFVGAGDVVEIVVFDEEVVEEFVEVGMHGRVPNFQRAKGPNAECGVRGREKSQMANGQIANEDKVRGGWWGEKWAGL